MGSKEDIANAVELAGIVERYAQEWLEQQAVAGVVIVDDASKRPAQRRFTLPNAHAYVLTEDDSEACMKPCAAIVPWAGQALDIIVDEFRAGQGAAFGLFGLHDVPSLDSNSMGSDRANTRSPQLV